MVVHDNDPRPTVVLSEIVTHRRHHRAMGCRGARWVGSEAASAAGTNEFSVLSALDP
jgi:hypothetical protein